MGRQAKIELFDDDFVVKVDASVTLFELDSYLHDFLKTTDLTHCADMPLSKVLGDLRDRNEQKSVLGLDIEGTAGETTKCGGQVIKNVAGYDLRKLYLGSNNEVQKIKSAYIRVEKLPLFEIGIDSALAGIDELDFISLRSLFNFDINLLNSSLSISFYDDSSIAMSINIRAKHDTLELRSKRIQNSLSFESIAETRSYKKQYLNPGNYEVSMQVIPSKLKDFTNEVFKALENNNFMAKQIKLSNFRLDLLKSTLILETSEEIFAELVESKILENVFEYFSPLIRVKKYNGFDRDLEQKMNFSNNYDEQKFMLELKKKFDPEQILGTI